MAIEIKNELAYAAIVDGADGGAAIQLFGMTFTRTGVGVYSFSMADDIDPTQYGIYCKAGINDLAQPGGRFTAPKTLEVRSYLPDGTPADNAVLFVELHRYPGVVGATYPAAPPIPIPTPPGAGIPATLSWGSNSVAASTVTKYLDPWFDDGAAPTTPIAWVAPRDGSIFGLHLIHNQPGGNGGAIVYTLTVNTLPTALSVSLASTGSTAVNNADTIGIAAGDVMAIEVTKAATIGSSPNNIVLTANFS